MLETSLGEIMAKVTCNRVAKQAPTKAEAEVMLQNAAASPRGTGETAADFAGFPAAGPAGASPELAPGGQAKKKKAAAPPPPPPPAKKRAAAAAPTPPAPPPKTKVPHILYTPLCQHKD